MLKSKLHILIIFLLLSIPQTSLAHQIDADETPKYLGTNKITVFFSLHGKNRKIEILKTCALSDFKMFTYYFHETDYISDEGWGVRFEIVSRRDDLNICIQKDAEDVIYSWKSFTPSELKNQYNPNKRMLIETGKSKFVDNVKNPTLIEYIDTRITLDSPKETIPSNVIVVPNRTQKSTLTQEQIDAFNAVRLKREKIFQINKVVISYYPPQVKNDLGQLQELDLFKGNIPNNKTLVSYHGYALSKQDWGQNSELSQYLKKFSKPTILDPEKYPEFYPLYMNKYDRPIMHRLFPYNDVAPWGLQHRFYFPLIYPKFVEGKYWDLRQLSFTEEYGYIVKKNPPSPVHPIREEFEPKNNKEEATKKYFTAIKNYRKIIKKYSETYPTRLIYGALSKIKMGDTILDLSKYSKLLDHHPKYIWVFDPKTELLFQLGDNSFDLY